MHRLVIALSFLGLAAALSGCGDGKREVEGEVTYDGEPVSRGAITFERSEGGLVREGSVITDGKFKTRVPPGKYKIELSAAKVVGKRTQKGFDGKDEVIEEIGELFPDRFNTKSELFQEITADTGVVKLDLKSKK